MSGIGQINKVLYAHYEAADVRKGRGQGEEPFVRAEQVVWDHTEAMRLADSFAKLRVAHQELQDAYLDTIYRLVLAAEYREDSTGDHITRIGRYCALLAKKLGMTMHEVGMLRYAAPMHDMGKIGIPDRILLKRNNLTAREFEIIKSHTLIGARILDGAKSDILQLGHRIALTHHENWDGSGYPFGLSGEAIPIMGRVVRIMDVFHALTSARSYKCAYPFELAIEIIRRGRETSFDPEVLDMFLENVDMLVQSNKEEFKNRNVSRKVELSHRDQEQFALLSNLFCE